MKRLARVTSAVIASLGINAIAAQHQFVQLEQAAVIDGKLDESVWNQAVTYELPYNVNPGENAPAPVKTEMKIYGTDKSLFVAFVAEDPNPENIRAYFRDRDSLYQDDFVGIVIDTFNDERRAYQFFVNALGAQADSIKDETRGGREDDSWDAIWESKGVITDTGYVVEMEIPFTALRFPEGNDGFTWGIDALRIYPRESRMVLASASDDRSNDCHLCQIHKLDDVKNLKQGNNFQVTPTLTALRFDSKDTINDDDMPTMLGDWQEGDIDPEFGLDVRWGISQGLVLNATINPDFSQVEADAAQLDINNTFSLFFSEKRPFFLDGKDYFQTPRMNLVHTRNISAPDYGLKVTGKNGDHSYGVLVANDESTGFLLPGALSSSLGTVSREDADGEEVAVKSKVAVARYRQDIGDRSNVGVLVTSRTADDYSNTVASIDGTYQFDKANKLVYQFAFSETENPDSLVEEYADDDFLKVLSDQSDMAYSLQYRHTQNFYHLSAAYQNFGDEFRSDMGFINKVDYERVILGGRRYWDGEPGSKWTRYGMNGDWDKTWDQDGNLLEQEIESYFWIHGPMQFFAELGLLARERYWKWSEEDANGNDVWFDEMFDENRINLFARFDPMSNLRAWTWMAKGDHIDFANGRLGEKTNFDFGLNYKLGRNVKAEIQRDWVKMEVDGGELFTATQYDARFNFHFDMKSYLRLIIQYTDIERNQALYRDDVESRSKYMSTQLTYAYKINPQTLFYLGYSDGGFQDDDLDRIERDKRSIFMKMSYAWQL